MTLLRGPFADSRFRLLLAGQSLSSFGDTALYLTLGIPALFAPAAGHLVDRVRRRPLLIWGNALTAALVLLLLAVHSRSQLWIIYLVAFGYGVAFSVLGSYPVLPGHDHEAGATGGGGWR